MLRRNSVRQQSARKSKSSWSLTNLEQRLLLAADAGQAAVCSTSADVSATESGVVVFVDSRAAELVASEASVSETVRRGAELVLLEPDADGVEQIQKHLAKRTGIQAVHLISHGRSGSIQLGSTELNASNLQEYSRDLSEWSGALADGADVLIYGCDVASTTTGQQFVQRFASLVGADVAASVDRTGNASSSADWDLEYNVGIVRSDLALTSQAMQRFRAHLAIEIHAAGTAGDELAQVQLGDQILATFQLNNDGLLSGNFETYTVDYDGADINDLRVSFVNDGVGSNGTDRNLAVDWVRVDGTQYETENGSVYSINSWDGNGIGSGYRFTELLVTDGYFDYGSSSRGNDFSGGSTVRIFASGDDGSEEMLLLVDGQEVARFSGVQNGGAEYVHQLDQFVIADQVRVALANDASDPATGFDRNLLVDRIQLNGITYQTEDASVFSTGTWQDGQGVVPGFRQSEYLNINGYFQYNAVPAGASTGAGTSIEIFARGETGDESMQLLIDGNVVQTYTNISQNLGRYEFTTDQTVSADRIRVAFINSTYAPEVGYDQNLIVDAITVNGQRFETESPATFSTSTYIDGQGISSGNLQTETLHSDGYFQYSSSGGSDPGDPNPPQSGTSIEFETDNFIVNEGEGNVVLTVVRSGELDRTSTVDYSVPGGFALPGQDFQQVSGTLTFNPGETRKSFTVPLINDNVPEGVETFTVELSGVSGANFGTDRTTIVTVFDNDNSNPPGSLNVQLPDGFVARRVAGNVNFAGPTGLKVASDGRVFVTEKFGRIYVVENGQRIETPFSDLSSQVYSVGTSQGLAGFALDPNFDSNGHVYVLYTANENGVRFGRLERYTVSSSNRNQIDVSSRRILIGQTAADGFPDGGDIHLVGDLKFGNDGSLLISYGDAAANGDNNAAFNAQDLSNLGGVIARVNPANGQGYASNPFYTGNPNDVQSRIWAFGLRNPYRFEVADDGSTNPNDGRPGTLYIGDVGFLSQEELNIARGGENFGWPYFEGNLRFLGNEDPNNYASPAATFARSEARTSIGGAIVDDSSWPASYQNTYFHADFFNGWIRAFGLDDQGNFTGQRGFATGTNGITDLEYDPVTRQLYFVALNQANNFQGELYAIGFEGSSNGGFSPSEVSTGSDGVAFAVTSQEQVWRRDGSSWTQLPGSYTKISVQNSNSVWGIDAFGTAARWNGSQWDRIDSPPLSDIGVSGNGNVVGIGTAGNILRFDGSQWNGVSGTLVDIEVDDNGVITGVNAQGQIWQNAGSWSQISGTLVDVSVGNDGAIWGTNAQGQVWRRTNNAWQQQSVSLQTISVTNDSDVWGVDLNGQVRRWNGSDWQFV